MDAEMSGRHLARSGRGRLGLRVAAAVAVALGGMATTCACDDIFGITAGYGPSDAASDGMMPDAGISESGRPRDSGSARDAADSSSLSEAGDSAPVADTGDAAPPLTCEGGPCVTLLATDEANPLGIAVDPGSTGNVYFTNWAYSSQHGGVRGVPKDASRGAVDFPFQADNPTTGYYPRPFNVIRTAAHVCWTVFSDADFTGGAIDCSDPKGKSSHFVGGDGSPFGYPVGIVADDSEALFFVDVYSQNLGTVSAAQPDGGILTIGPAFPPPGNLPGWIALSPDGRMYWNDGARLLSANRDGSGAVALPGAPASAVAKVTGSIAIDGDWIYWMETQPDGSSILYRELRGAGTSGVGWACPGSGSCPETLAGGVEYALNPGNLVVDNGYVYWPNFTRGNIMRVKEDGSGEVEKVLQGVPSIARIAIDDAAVYFTRSYLPGFEGTVGTGTVGKFAKP
jgi:hypothetical protein